MTLDQNKRDSMVTVDGECLELIVAIANVAGHMEHAEKICVCDDAELAEVTLGIVEKWKLQGDDTTGIDFFEFVEYELYTKFKSEKK